MVQWLFVDLTLLSFCWKSQVWVAVSFPLDLKPGTCLKPSSVLPCLARAIGQLFSAALGLGEDWSARGKFFRPATLPFSEKPDQTLPNQSPSWPRPCKKDVPFPGKLVVRGRIFCETIDVVPPYKKLVRSLSDLRTPGACFRLRPCSPACCRASTCPGRSTAWSSFPTGLGRTPSRTSSTASTRNCRRTLGWG